MASLAPEEKRAYARMRPRGVVSLAIFQGARIPPAYAIVNDISELGACVHSDKILARGQDLKLRIRWGNDDPPFEADAQVAWTRPAFEREDGVCGGAISGVRFVDYSVGDLRRTLHSPDFEHPSGGSAQFDTLVESLRPFIERLGHRLRSQIAGGPDTDSEN